eukprot:2180188-Pleurochrysis_carterae.AAC.2
MLTKTLLLSCCACNNCSPSCFDERLSESTARKIMFGACICQHDLCTFNTIIFLHVPVSDLLVVILRQTKWKQLSLTSLVTNISIARQRRLRLERELLSERTGKCAEARGK